MWSRVPFFVCKRVRKRVEQEARRGRSKTVRLAQVNVCRKRFVKQMDRVVKGFQEDHCFGPVGFPTERWKIMGWPRNWKRCWKKEISGLSCTIGSKSR
ncbi:PCP reductase family protein [Desulfacinum hydrothermale]|uniref:PCP reductase family protein n=1 Tax=Desulfacinum hydrothermale TaxID=109258 RepID=UPI0014822157|nr:PCP reductase family protein [Desulfacinum hydrothermale]